MTAPAGVFRHPSAIVESERVGEGTRVWAFAHILPGAVIGRDCNICDHVFVENDVVVGDRVTIKCGVQLWDGVRLEDDVFVGPNATFTNDAFPRSKQYPTEFSKTIVQRGASIGANATILPGLTIGTGAMVGAGAVVTGSVPPNAIVVGNPAAISGYVATTRVAAGEAHSGASPASGERIGVGDARVIRLPKVFDLRGSLVVAELDSVLTFQPRRFFVVFDVPSREVRGEHAHRRLAQFLVCVRGRCAILLDDGVQRAEVALDDPSIGVLVPPLVWSVQYKFSPDAMLLVLASEPYDSSEYIRDYGEFRSIVGRSGTPPAGG